MVIITRVITSYNSVIIGPLVISPDLMGLGVFIGIIFLVNIFPWRSSLHSPLTFDLRTFLFSSQALQFPNPVAVVEVHLGWQSKDLPMDTNMMLGARKGEACSAVVRLGWFADIIP